MKNSKLQRNKKSHLKDIVMLLLGVISGLYIINPTAGVLELIPDIIPVLGNLDEAAATALLLSVLSYFGYDLTSWFRSRN